MEVSEKEQKIYSIKKGDILITRTSETVDELAMSCVALKDYPQATYSGFVKRLRPKTEGIVYDRFMAFFLRSKYFRKVIECNTIMTLRASFNEDIFSFLDLYLPDYETQKRIGDLLYHMERKRENNAQINDNLEAMLTAVFFNTFSSKETAERSKLNELMSFGNGKSRPKTDGTIPVYGGNGVLSFTDQYNIENAILIGRVGAYCGSVYLEQGICWVSDNAIFAKSKVSTDEFFDYFLLKSLNLFNHHVGTGQQLLTQEILNNIEVAKPDYEQIEAFNEKAKAVYETITDNKSEIVRLQELSDLLLSRLAG